MDKKDTKEKKDSGSEYGYSYGPYSYKTKYRQVDTRKSNRRIIVSFILLVLLAVTVSVLIVKTGSTYYLSRQTKEYLSNSGLISNDLKYNLDAKNEKFTTDRLKIVFSPDDILIFSYNLWSYGLYVNDTLIKSPDPITIHAGDRISIREEQKKTALPKAFVNIGRLTRGDENDNMANHFTLNTKGYNLEKTSVNLINTYTIKPNTVKRGDKFMIVISNQLATRLNFEREIIEVTVI